MFEILGTMTFGEIKCCFFIIIYLLTIRHDIKLYKENASDPIKFLI